MGDLLEKKLCIRAFYCYDCQGKRAFAPAEERRPASVRLLWITRSSCEYNGIGIGRPQWRPPFSAARKTLKRHVDAVVLGELPRRLQARAHATAVQHLDPTASTRVFRRRIASDRP